MRLRVRIIGAALLAIVVAAGALASTSLGNNSSRGRTYRRSSLGISLPAPITVAGGRVLRRVSYRIARDGQVSRIAAIQSLFPHDSAWFPDTDVWYSIRRGHLVVGRRGRQLWRSHGDFPQPNRTAWEHVRGVTVGSHTAAFSYDGKLYLAPLGGAERMVARGEFPLGWTAGGLLVYRPLGHELILRSASGALVKTMWRQRKAFGYSYDLTTGTVYWLAHGVVMAARGTRAWRLASLGRLGLSAEPSSLSLQPLGRLLELQGNSRLIFLRTDGTVFGSTPLPRSGGAVESISGGPLMAPQLGAVAFAAVPEQAPGGFGTEGVYVLRVGGRNAIRVHGARVNLTTCERGADLQWHRNWLLYRNTERDLVTIDTTGAHRSIDLSRIVKRLPGTGGGFSAYWSGQPTGGL